MPSTTPDSSADRDRDFPVGTINEDISSGDLRIIETPVRISGFNGVPRFSVFGFTAASVAALLIVVLQNVPDLPVPQAEERPLPEAELHAAAPELPISVSASFAPDTVSLEGSSDASVLSETVTDIPVTVVIPEDPTPRPDNHIGVFLTAASVKNNDFLRRTMEDLKAVSGSALVFDVKGGVVLFHSAAPMANEIDLVRPMYELPAIIQLAHEHGLFTIGRFVAIKDGGLTTRLPALRIKHPVTGRALSPEWIDPADETAIRYNMEVICELAGYGIDEINLDYIRFSTAEFGALAVYSGQQKADRVETFIRAARETIDRCGPSTKLGLSTFAILGWNYENNVETLGQDVARFAPLVDIISPMAYPATFSVNAYYDPAKNPRSRMYWLVYRTLQGYQEFLGPEQSLKLRPWIQGYGVTTKNMTDQMDAVYDVGLCGFMVWNANNAYAPTYSAMKKQQMPERCW